MRTGGRVIAAMAGLGLAVTACSSSTSTPAPQSAPTPAPTPVQARQAAAAPRPNQPVTIAFGGDVHFEGASVQALHGGMSAIAPTLKAADLAMVNLETAITTRGTPQPKTYKFRAPASAFTALRDAGIDVVTEANNHGVDYGPVGLHDTLAAIKSSGFPVVGIGANEAEAYKPWRTTINGQRIAVLGATQVIDSNLRASWTAGPDHAGLASAFRVSTLLSAVRAARRSADIVVVYLHWGTEYQDCPNGQQFALAPQLVKAGADVVVGSHAHEQLGAGWLGHAYVDYGLGNFVFYAHGRPVATRSGVLTLTVRRHSVSSATWTPAEIESGVPVPVQGSDAIAARQRIWTDLRPCTHLSAKPD